MAKLTGTQRKRLSERSFAIPEERKYPINDRSHAANALSRASGKPVEARVRAAVRKRFPDMGKSSKDVLKSGMRG